jgi:O-antigen/teichoic acid export membrane protein
MGISSAIVGATTIVLNLVTISYLKMGYMGWFVSTCLGTGLSFLFYFFPLYFKYKLTPIFKIRKRFLINQLKVALPIIPHNYSSYLLNVSDRLVMNVLGINVSQIGVYNIAYTFGNYIDFAGGALGMAISPIYTKLYSIRREADVRTLTFVLQALFLFGSFLLCLWLKEVFIFLIKNNELQNGYSLAIIVIMGFNYRPMYWAVGLKISYYEMTKYLWRFSFVAGIVNIALNFILIPIYGYQVAAVTSFIGMMYIGFSGFFLSSYRKLENDKFYPIAWMALITGLSFLVYLLRDIEVFSKALVSLFLSVVLVSGFFRFKKEILKISI